ncbi:Branched chain amino acid ABC transporter periplasmic ligand-binding protein (fragment) [Aeromicrobium sp. 9AM]
MTDETFLAEFSPLVQDMSVVLDAAQLTSDDPKVKKFVADFTKQTGKAPTKFNAIGWVQAELTAEGLRQAKGLNRPCLMRGLEQIKGFETGIIPPVTWGKGDRSGVEAIGVGKISGSKVTVLENTVPID